MHGVNNLDDARTALAASHGCWRSMMMHEGSIIQLRLVVLRADGVVPLRGPGGRDHPGPWKVAAAVEPHRRRRPRPRPDDDVAAPPRRLLHASSCAGDAGSGCSQHGGGEEEEEDHGGCGAPEGATTHHFSAALPAERPQRDGCYWEIVEGDGQMCTGVLYIHGGRPAGVQWWDVSYGTMV